MMKNVACIGITVAAVALLAGDASAQGRGRAQGSGSGRIESSRTGTGAARGQATGRGNTSDRSIADILLGRERRRDDDDRRDRDRRYGDDRRDRDRRYDDRRDRDDRRERRIEDCSIAEILLGCGRGDRDRRDERNDRRGHDARGPAFCRSGAGHPVHGRRWCVDKGFGLGDTRARDRDARILRLPATRERSIADVLGALGRRGG